MGWGLVSVKKPRMGEVVMRNAPDNRRSMCKDTGTQGNMVHLGDCKLFRSSCHERRSPSSPARHLQYLLRLASSTICSPSSAMMVLTQAVPTSSEQNPQVLTMPYEPGWHDPSHQSNFMVAGRIPKTAPKIPVP